MSRVRYEPRSVVKAARRKYLTRDQKVARWEALGGCCARCGNPCDPYGGGVIWDHPIGVFYGEETDPNRMEPHHNTPECAGAKTANDATVRAHIKRLIKKAGPRQKAVKLKGRGWNKLLSRRMNGEVVRKTP